jgi:hypothetical protein
MKIPAFKALTTLSNQCCQKGFFDCKSSRILIPADRHVYKPNT